jgi:hypothetical protein
MEARIDVPAADRGSGPAHPGAESLPPADDGGAAGSAAAPGAAATDPAAAEGRAIGDRILEIAEEDVVWSTALVELKVCPSGANATRWLSRLHDRRELSFFGRYRFRGGTKPFYGYTNAPLKLDNKAHEFLLSKVKFWFVGRATTIRRGAKVNPDVLPDLEMDHEIDGEDVGYDLEMDCKTMTQRRMRDRFQKLKSTGRTVLVVTTGRKARRDHLLDTARGEGLEAVYATTFDCLAAEPTGRVWAGVDGKDHELEI